MAQPLSVRLQIEITGSKDSSEALFCVIEQDTVSSA